MVEPYPSEKWWSSSVGMIIPTIWKKNVPIHQPVFNWLLTIIVFPIIRFDEPQYLYVTYHLHKKNGKPSLNLAISSNLCPNCGITKRNLYPAVNHHVSHRVNEAFAVKSWSPTNISGNLELPSSRHRSADGPSKPLIHLPRLQQMSYL